MDLFNRFRFFSMRMLIVAIVLTACLPALIFIARAQGQTCRDINQITVCGDQVTDLTSNGGGFKIIGNVKIGPKGGAAVVQVRNTGSVFDGTILSENITQPSYFHFNQTDPNTGTTDFIIGEVFLINDPTGLGLLRTFVFDHPPAGGEVTAGRLFVDTVGGRIFLPAEGAVPIFNQRGVKRNQAYQLPFISRVGALSFYKDGGSVDELSVVDGEFTLFTKKFIGVVPINLKVGDTAANPNLQIKMRAEFNETGVFNGSVDGFKLSIGGLLMDASGIVVKAAQGSNPAEFTAGAVKVLKSDNPNVPNLDPTDANLIFAFTNLKYKNGNWEIGGVEVPIKDWEFGPAFKMINQTLGIINEAASQSLQIKSTMQFGSGTDASKLPITMKIGRAVAGDGTVKPIFSAGLQDIKPKLGTFTFNLTGAVFVGDAAQDFYGIQATTAAVQWPAHLGGQTAAAVNGFKLGMGSNKKFKFQIGSGAIGLPPFENKVFKGTLQATTGVVAETLVITGTGTFNINLPGNANSAGVGVTAIMRYNKDVSSSSAVVFDANTMQASSLGAPGRICFGPGNVVITCPTDSPPPPSTTPKPFELKLSGFSFKLAGFGLAVTNPRSTDDGGFAADNVGLSLPVGMLSSGSNSGILVQGLVVKGNGEVTISGGGFELAPIQVGSVQFVGLRGNFIKKPDGSYEFQAGGKLPLPGIEPGAGSGGISVNLTVRLKPDSSFQGAGVVISFGSPPLPPIPLGSSGMNLTKITGAFDINNQTLTIGISLTATSKFALPLGSLGSIPIAKADGGVTVQFNPFKFIGNAQLSILIFNVANATVRIGDGEGFDGGSGMNAKVTVNAAIMSGEFRMRVGKGAPGNPEKRRFAAAATWILGIQKGQYGTGRPPFNLGGIEANLSGGVFNDTNFSPSRETVGVRATICGPNGNICIGLFLNLSEGVGSGNFIDFTNLDKYVLIPAAVIRAAAARGEAGFASRTLTVAEASERGLVLAADQLTGKSGIFQEIVDIPITQTTTLLAGIDYTSGNPQVSLQLPNNTTVTEQTVNGTTQTVLTDTTSITKSIYFVIHDATPGTYKLIIDNGGAYEAVHYTINAAPQLTINSATCDATGGVPQVTVSCANPVNAAESSTINASSATVSWNATDVDSPNAVVSVGYVKDSGDKNNVDYSAINFSVENLPLGAGTQSIDFKEAGNGSYRLVVAVDDDANGIVYQASDTVITVDDKLAPAVPSNLTAVSQAGELLIKWDQNSEKDLAGYDIGFGLVNDSSKFVYTRTMGPKEIVTGTNKIVDAKIWGLDDNTQVFYGLRAYDHSGNKSDWTPLKSATPWAVAPNTWSPVPNGFGEQAVVEIAFAMPMNFDSLQNKLTVKDSQGQPVEGTTYYLTDLDGNAIGIGFQPKTPITGPASAVLKGGADGVKAADGRTMGADYSWSFTLQAPSVVQPIERLLFVPILLR